MQLIRAASGIWTLAVCLERTVSYYLKNLVSHLLISLSWMKKGKLIGSQTLTLNLRIWFTRIFLVVIKEIVGVCPVAICSFTFFISLYVLWIWRWYSGFMRKTLKKLRCSDSTSACRRKNSYECSQGVLQLFLPLLLPLDWETHEYRRHSKYPVHLINSVK